MELLIALLSTPLSPAFVDLQPDWLVFAFTASLALGDVRALRADSGVARYPDQSGCGDEGQGRGLTDSRERFGLRRALVVLQVSLSLVLLVGALLFVRSFRNLLTLNAGFRQDGILDNGYQSTPSYAFPPQRRLRVPARPARSGYALSPAWMRLRK